MVDAWTIQCGLSPHASVETTKETVGYVPSRATTEGVGEFIEWYRENRERYEPLVRSS